MKKILSVDGGGIRGIGPAYIIDKLDQALKKKSDKGVADTFDLFVGTSTGCILAAGLAASPEVNPKLSTSDLVELYRNRGAEMFVRTPLSAPSFDLLAGMYQTSAKHKVLREILGTLTLGQLERNFLGTYFDMDGAGEAIFANGGPQYRKVGDNDYASVALADVVNASSNAPIYFDPSAVQAQCSLAADGGAFANNPSMCAVIEACKTWGVGLDEVMVVSLGCGSLNTPLPTWSQWGLLHWASPQHGVPILEVILGAQADVVEYQMAHLLREGTTYFRLQYALPPQGARIDDVSPVNLDAIIQSAESLPQSDYGRGVLAKIVEHASTN